MISELVGCFDRTMAYLQALVADLSDDEWTLQPPGVPNHAAWTVGHVIFSCQEIAAELGVPRWLPSEWESLFGYGSVPARLAGSPHASGAVLTGRLADASGRLRAALLGAAERSLTDPLPDEAARRVLPTLGDALVQIVAGHLAFHAGQLAAWRRAIGRAPAGVFL